MNNFYDPIIDGVQHITYWRNPTKAEIAFGEGAIHYRDFPESEVKKAKKAGWRYKRWLKAKDDGLRYYRSI